MIYVSLAVGRCTCTWLGWCLWPCKINSEHLIWRNDFPLVLVKFKFGDLNASAIGSCALSQVGEFLIRWSILNLPNHHIKKPHQSFPLYGTFTYRGGTPIGTMSRTVTIIMQSRFLTIHDGLGSTTIPIFHSWNMHVQKAWPHFLICQYCSEHRLIAQWPTLRKTLILTVSWPWSYAALGL